MTGRRLSVEVGPLARRSAVLLLAEVRSSRPLVVLPLAALVAGLVMAVAGLSPWLWILVPCLGLGTSLLIAGSALVADYRPHLARILRRYGVPRIPPLTSFENRDPELAVRLDRAWRGFEKHNLPVLRDVASGGLPSGGLPARRRIDACLCLVDWHLAHREEDEALSWLENMSGEALARPSRRQRSELVALSGELRAHLSPGSDPKLLRILASVRGGRRTLIPDRDREIVLANLRDPFDPCRAVNRLLRRAHFSEVAFREGWFASDGPPRPEDDNSAGGPKVTVIVPAFNAEQTIAHAVGSVLRQTWPNLEVIVVDDASTDRTSEVVRSICETDSRVRLFALCDNRGTYPARNLGVEHALGEFVTVLDADDWMHPDRIAVQVRHLLGHPQVIANQTSLIRVSPRGMVVRKSIACGDFIGMNYASLLIRRATLADIGGWDPIRGAADSELIERLKSRFGRESVIQLHRGIPLTIARFLRSSLTADSSTGITSHLWDQGARQLYGQAYQDWHRRERSSLTMPAATESRERVFAVPPALVCRDRAVKVDVVLLSDLSLPGGTTASNIEEIKANREAGLVTGLIHNRAPHLRYRPINPKILALHADDLKLLSAGDEVDCDVLVIKYPPSALEFADRFPHVNVRGDVVIAVSQAPWTGYAGERREVYRIGDVNSSVRQRFAKPPVWSPVGPAVREALLEHHADDIRDVRLATRDWYEIINPNDWRSRHTQSAGGTFRIGRHARDSVWKWPATRQDLSDAYPSANDVEVSILGGAEVPRRILGGLPGNWRVLPFDSMPPREYLNSLDALVFFPHPDMVEAFGRTILEALACGLPVITDHRFKPLFGESLITVRPSEVADVISRLRSDPDYRRRSGDAARAAVTERFGYESHLERLRRHGLRHQAASAI